MSGAVSSIFGSSGANKAAGATTNPNFQTNAFYSPFGSSTYNQKSGATTYQPSGLANDAYQDAQSYNGLTNSLAGTLSQPYDINSALAGPLYQSSAALLEQPINQQYAQTQLANQNQLNAQNQTGSSYAALTNNYAQQNYNNQIQNADNQARTDSVNAYNQQFQNNNTALGTLGAQQNTYYNQAFQPLTYGLQAMQQGTAANSALASYNNNLYNTQQSGINSAEGLVGSALGAGGNALRGYLT